MVNVTEGRGQWTGQSWIARIHDPNADLVLEFVTSDKRKGKKEIFWNFQEGTKQQHQQIAKILLDRILLESHGSKLSSPSKQGVKNVLFCNLFHQCWVQRLYSRIDDYDSEGEGSRNSSPVKNAPANKPSRSNGYHGSPVKQPKMPQV